MIPISLTPTALKVVIGAMLFAVVFGAGSTLGYKFADGRCAIARVKVQDDLLDAAYVSLERAQEEASAAKEQAAEAMKRLAAQDARQTKERIVYVKAPAAPDCRLDDSTFSLLLKQIRRSNGDSQNDPD